MGAVAIGTGERARATTGQPAAAAPMHAGLRTLPDEERLIRRDALILSLGLVRERRRLGHRARPVRSW